MFRLLKISIVAVSYTHLCGTIRRTLKSPSKGTRLKFYKVIALPTLLYGSENWTFNERPGQSQSKRLKWDFSGTWQGMLYMIIEETQISVSYTHLDVYKRQVPTCSIPDNVLLKVFFLYARYFFPPLFVRFFPWLPSIYTNVTVLPRLSLIHI